MSRRFFVRATYVYGKSIDVSLNTGGVIAAGFPSTQNAYDLNAERGRSNFDVGHTFSASFIWSPQVSRHFVLHDRQLSGTTTVYTGAPFTPKVANYDITTGGAAQSHCVGCVGQSYAGSVVRSHGIPGPTCGGVSVRRFGP